MSGEEKPIIRHIVTMNDSLSGTISHRYLFGVIPFALLTAYSKESAKERYTNGLTWDDSFDDEVKYYQDDKDIKDRAPYNGREIVRHYSNKRDGLLADDVRLKIGAVQKQETLVVEWFGVNDFMTVNALPTAETAEKVVQARMENVEKLYEAGYRFFVLFNWPDFSLTPRYQTEKCHLMPQAETVSAAFNRSFAEACDALRAKYPSLSLDIFDVNAFFRNVYTHPDKYGFDRNKIQIPFIKSDDFHLDIPDRQGYLFEDEDQPTAEWYEHLADSFYAHCQRAFSFGRPVPPLRRSSPPPTMWAPSPRQIERGAAVLETETGIRPKS